MGTVYPRYRKKKNGKKVGFWYMEYRLNGKKKKESVGKMGLFTKTMAKELLRKRERQVKLGQWEMINAKIPTLSSFSKEYIEYIRDKKENPFLEKIRAINKTSE